MIELPIFPVPAHIDGWSYGAGIGVISKDTFELLERGVEVSRPEILSQIAGSDLVLRQRCRCQWATLWKPYVVGGVPIDGEIAAAFFR